ncbi:hypothetical protein SNEBB_003858 [Seison nebaliae]|nr:hypothetical protein SNEBB_003858 [Seison nebaliae]
MRQDLYIFQSSDNANNNNHEIAVSTEKPTYSWDKNNTTGTDDYLMKNIENDVVIRLKSEEIAPLSIIDCRNSRIFILKDVQQMTIDHCSNCIIVLAAVRGSLFIRNCHNCQFYAATQQLRTRDCSDSQINLLCTTKPIIESSNNIKFQCLTMNFDGYDEILQKTDIDPFHNLFNQIHNFTPEEGQHSFATEAERLTNKCDEIPDELQAIRFTSTNISQLIPFVYPEPIFTNGLIVLIYHNAQDADCIAYKIISHYHSMIDGKELNQLQLQQVKRLNVAPTHLTECQLEFSKQIYNGKHIFMSFLIDCPIEQSFLHNFLTSFNLSNDQLFWSRTVEEYQSMAILMDVLTKQ